MIPAGDSARPRVLDRVGGTRGMVGSAVPVLVLVVAYPVATPSTAVVVAVAAALALTGLRLLHGERLSSAIGGLVGVGLAAGIVAWTGWSPVA